MTLTLGEHLYVGGNFALNYFFGNTRERRIKTNDDQTSFLLLAKTCLYREYGLWQQYNLWVEFAHCLGGLSFKVDYEFTKKDRDTISVYTNEFNDIHTNTSISAQAWTAHHMIMLLKYHFDAHQAPDARAKPYISLHAKFPVNGSQSALFKTFGVVAAIDF
jgi:hypothetical protein